MSRGGFRTVVILLPLLWLTLFVVAPFLQVLWMSFSEAVLAQPPVAPLLRWEEDGSLGFHGRLDNYDLVLGDPLYRAALWESVAMAGLATLCCLIMAYPLAMAIAGANGRSRDILLFLIVLPFWTSLLIRIYAITALIRDSGPIASLLSWLGLGDGPLGLMNTDAAVLLGLVYSYLPFMVLPLAVALERIEPSLHEAAADLGAGAWTRFRTVILPLSLPGAFAGSLLVFIPAVGEFVVPSMLGGPDSLMIGKTVWEEFFNNRDWPLAAALAVVVMAVLAAPLLAAQRLRQRIEAGA